MPRERGGRRATTPGPTRSRPEETTRGRARPSSATTATTHASSVSCDDCDPAARETAGAADWPVRPEDPRGAARRRHHRRSTARRRPPTTSRSGIRPRPEPPGTTRAGSRARKPACRRRTSSATRVARPATQARRRPVRRPPGLADAADARHELGAPSGHIGNAGRLPTTYRPVGCPVHGRPVGVRDPRPRHPGHPRPARREPLRIAWLIYRGNPHCGGQGVYTRHLARELTDARPRGHGVRRPALARARRPRSAREGAEPRPLPAANPFRVPWPHEFRDSIDLQEFAIMCTAGFPEPYTFSLRVTAAAPRPPRRLRPRPRQPVPRPRPAPDDATTTAGRSSPRCTTRSPSTATSTSRTPRARCRELTLRRWYGFLGMQMEVARADPAPRHRVGDLEARHRRADGRAGRPAAHRAGRRRPGDLPAAARRRARARPADDDRERRRPVKGLAPLLEALAKVRTERDDAHLVVIGQPEGAEPHPGAHRPARARRRGRVRDGRHRRADRRAVRRGRGRLRAVALRGLLAARRRGDGLRRARSSPRPAARSPRSSAATARPASSCPPGDPDALAVAVLRALDDAELRARHRRSRAARARSTGSPGGAPPKAPPSTGGSCSTTTRAPTRDARRCRC